MKLKNILFLSFIFFMKTSCMELVVSKENRQHTLYLPQDIVNTIMQFCDKNSIQKIRDYKSICSAFNNAFHYWMIDPTIIQSEDIEVCTKGLISFASSRR
jgi:hypothetical protein